MVRVLACACALAVVWPVMSAASDAIGTGEDHPFTPGGDLVPAGAAGAQSSDSILYAVNIMSRNKVGMTISNYGFIGTNFTSRAPSFEYPLGSGYQHMDRGGLWIGAASYDTVAFIGVSTACQDGMQGSGGASATEYTPATNTVYQRSTLTSSRYYREGAVSEQDFITRFSDRPAKKATGYREDHRPLGVIVTQYNYAWSFSDYANINFFHYVVKNDGPPLVNAHIAMYAQLTSGNLNAFSQVPPSGWFRKSQPAWIDSLNLYVENYCLNKPIPGNCFYSTLPYLAGIKLLGCRPGDITRPADKKVTFQCWSYDPGSYARDQDTEKYALMSAGTKSTLAPLPDSLAPYSGDPIALISVGPFAVINSGDSVAVDFAYIGAPMAFDASGNLLYTDIARYAVTAQRAWDLDYLVPVPPPSPSLKIVVRDHAADLYWDDAPEHFIDKTTDSTRSDFEGYRVYLGEERVALHRVAQFDSCCAFPNDTTGFNTGFAAIRLDPPASIDGRLYGYKTTFDHLRDGFRYWAAVTSYDLGTRQIESLESGEDQNEVMFVPAPSADEARAAAVTVFPNPYRVEAAWDAGQQARDHYLWFTNLPPECDIRIYTLSGSLVYQKHFNGSTEDGRDARGVYQPGSDLPAHLSGTTYGWNMVTREGQAAATGLYLWAIEDTHTSKRQRGKFLLVKSDRESNH